MSLEQHQKAFHAVRCIDNVASKTLITAKEDEPNGPRTTFEHTPRRVSDLASPQMATPNLRAHAEARFGPPGPDSPVGPVGGAAAGTVAAGRGKQADHRSGERAHLARGRVCPDSAGRPVNARPRRAPRVPATRDIPVKLVNLIGSVIRTPGLPIVTVPYSMREAAP